LTPSDVKTPHPHRRSPFDVGFAAEQFGVFAALDEDTAVGHFDFHLQTPKFAFRAKTLRI
jgi:hypothetical protein